MVTINNVEVKALIDTGSDITTIKESTFNEKKVAQKLKKNHEKVRGVGGYSIIKGKFPAKISIDDDVYDTECYVMNDENIDDELIVGLDIINQSKLQITSNGIKME